MAQRIEYQTQFAVIGGGLAGVCAALAAARMGIETVLVNNRPTLGGNSSSEVRVWTRGAVGAGNLFAEEMGLLGLLKLENLYKNPDANPVFWDEILLDAVLNQEHLTLLLNTDITEITVEAGRVLAVSGAQQQTERRVHVAADMFLDATGDGTLGAMAGVPWEQGEGGTMGNSILFFTRRENHPVRFVAPDYAYGMEEIERLVGSGGRIVSEQMTGSDCWWFEFGGALNTIDDAQQIGIELKRLVMGVWNYIKNSGKFDADCATLEWLGSLPGKRESRRMRTDYMPTARDILEGRVYDDSAFYGGWYIDSHPAGGMRDTEKEHCEQIPVPVYPLPLRSLYHSGVSNLLFAGRNIGVEREVFFSSRVMNTCALSGQAAGTLAAFCIRHGRQPAAECAASVEAIQCHLWREDMLIPGVKPVDPADLAATAQVNASSFHTGCVGPFAGTLALTREAFAVFPALPGQEIQFFVESSGPTALRARVHSAMLPNRLQLGQPLGDCAWEVEGGCRPLTWRVPADFPAAFCVLVWPPQPAVRLYLSRPLRTGFLCGWTDSPRYGEPALCYSQPQPSLYTPAHVQGGPNRPWGGTNQWRTAPEDKTPWLELRWPAPVRPRELRLYLDPELSMELPSSRGSHWQDSHKFAPRTGMPEQLLRDFEILLQREDGGWESAARIRENRQRLVSVPLEGKPVQAVLLQIFATWGGGPAAVFQVSAFARPVSELWADS